LEDLVVEHTSAWFTVEQIAAHLQVSKETVYRWLDRGKIPAHRVGKQWRFLVSEVDEWVRRGEATENPREQSSEELK
jgi:excisionase family DNA binding protein